VLGTASAKVGRFYPDHFDTVVTQGCAAGSFTYSAQPFTLTVTALNTSSATTLNYAGALNFARSVVLSDAQLAPGNLANTAVAANAFLSGVATASTAFTFNVPSTLPSTVLLRAVDTDGVSSATGAQGSAAIRSGRVHLYNAYGSELLGLPITLGIEYWDISGWVKNSADTCTALTAQNFSFDYSNPAGTSLKPNHLSACETALTLSGLAPDYALSLSKPGKPNDGWTTVSLNLGSSALSASGQCVTVGGAGAADIPANKPWLQFNWKNAGNTNPTARAIFGIYKRESSSSSGTTIYRRENF
jgi:MSHA biogenesis protein MshQ